VITNFMQPIANESSSTGLGYISGAIGTWTGVASNFFAAGTTAVLQGGTIPVTNPLPGQSNTTLAISSYQTSSSATSAKARVWRTVQ
jgi:hypothetical protein